MPLILCSNPRVGSIPQGSWTQIQKRLACLPIYLTGCKELTCVAGPTYCARLWCIIEMYCWLQSKGGSTRGITVLPRHRPQRDPSALFRESSNASFPLAFGHVGQRRM